MNHDASLENLTQIVGNIFDAYSVAMFLPRDESFALTASFSLGDSIAAGTKITPGQGLVGWIIRNRKPLLVRRFDQTRSFLGYYQQGEEERIKAFMGCPVPHLGGALCVDSKTTHSFGEKDQKILSQFASLVSMIRGCGNETEYTRQTSCLFNYLQMLPKLREKFPRWSSFLKHFLVLLAQSSAFPYCFLAVRDEWGKSYLLEGWNEKGFVDASCIHDKFKIGSGVVGWTFKHQQAVFTEDAVSSEGVSLFGRDVGPQMKSVMCLPLVVHKKTRGVLVLADEEARDIDTTLKGFAGTIADYLALFLENLYFKNQIQKIKTATT